MGRIPDETIETIRDRIDIVDVVGRYVTLRRSGQSQKGLCPFHDEKTPSFNVHPGRQIFYCFGCGVGGNVFSFLMRHENLTFPEAARQLARECGVEIPESGGESGELEQLVAANEAAQRLYRATLEGRDGAAARAYLERRGLDRDAWARHGIGLAPERWDGVVRALEAARIPARVGERAGLLAPRQSGGHYDRLRGRVSFPIQDARGRIVAFGGRALADGQEPKYLNTPESPLFRKRESFYGLPAALEAIRRCERVVVVEGYFDRIALAEAGLAESLATCGTALGPEHSRGLRRRTREVVLLFDGDEAGRRAARRALEVLLPAGLRVRAAALPPGEDPDSLLAREGPEALRSLVEAAPAALDVVIGDVVSRGIGSPFEKADAVAELAPLLARVPDPVERAEFTRRLALAAAVEPRAAEAAVREVRGEAPAEPAPVALPSSASSRESRPARRVAALLLDEPSLAGRLRPGEPESLFVEPDWRAFVCAVVASAREDRLADVEALASRLEERPRQLLLSLACETRPPLADAARVLDDELDALRERRRAEERRALTRRLADSSSTDARALLAEKQRQMEQKRAARGLSPTPAPDGGVELLP